MIKKSLIFIIYFYLILISTDSFSQINPSTISSEYQKAVAQETIKEPSQSKTYDYDNEKQLIIKQIEIITGDEETKYIIVPGDTLTISYQDRNKIITNAYKVSSSGEIHLPLINNVNVKGLNKKQARERITSLLKEFIRNPSVNIGINEEGRYLVVGAVQRPNVYQLRSSITIMDAIMEAGGFIREMANLKSVVLMRGGDDNPVTTRLNLKKMLAKGDRSDNITIKPGDIIYVPTSFIFHLDSFQKTIFRHIVTYYGLGGKPILDQGKSNSENIE